MFIYSRSQQLGSCLVVAKMIDHMVYQVAYNAMESSLYWPDQ